MEEEVVNLQASFFWRYVTQNYANYDLWNEKSSLTFIEISSLDLIIHMNFVFQAMIDVDVDTGINR